MSNFPKVSICIPTFNQVEYLTLTLNSIFIQNYTDYEIIISDDSNNTLVFDLVSEYISKGKQIKYFKNKIALGSPENWNSAIRYAKGEFIKIIHHDDRFVESSSLMKFIELFETNSDIGLVFSGSKISDGINKSRFHELNDIQFLNLKKDNKSIYRANVIGSPTAVMYRRSLNIEFDKNLKWLVDMEFYFQIMKKGSIINYTNQHLIETFIPTDRITNSCYMNKEVEIPEHLYFMEKHKLFDYKNINYCVELCLKLNVLNQKQIRECGFDSKINKLLLLLLQIKSSKFYLYYSKIVRKLKKY